MDGPVFQSLQELTWPGAIVVVGAIAVAVTALIKFFKKEDNPALQTHATELLRLNKEIELFAKDLSAIKDDLEEAKQSTSEDKKAFFKTISRLEEKIEKVSDLIIEVIRAQNS